jgi:hypothetical protein
MVGGFEGCGECEGEKQRKKEGKMEMLQNIQRRRVESLTILVDVLQMFLGLVKFMARMKVSFLIVFGMQMYGTNVASVGEGWVVQNVNYLFTAISFLELLLDVRKEVSFLKVGVKLEVSRISKLFVYVFIEWILFTAVDVANMTLSVPTILLIAAPLLIFGYDFFETIGIGPSHRTEKVDAPAAPTKKNDAGGGQGRWGMHEQTINIPARREGAKQEVGGDQQQAQQERTVRLYWPRNDAVDRAVRAALSKMMEGNFEVRQDRIQEKDCYSVEVPLKTAQAVRDQINPILVDNDDLRKSYGVKILKIQQ